MNIQNLINNAADILKQNNIINPHLDIEILLSSLIKKDRKYIMLNLKEKLNKIDLDNFKYLIERRRKGEPVAYIINKKEFWKNEFFITKDVLIPRPDTELLVEQILKITSKNKCLKILDIGVGSGCILLSILKEKKCFSGVGIDISKKSIEISKLNAKMLKVLNRAKFYNSDVDNFKIGKYDVIVSNPPYIKKLSLKYLEKNVVNFEPRQALNGGLDGISSIKKVIKKASVLIKKNGKLVLEIGYDQRSKVCDLLKENGFYINSVLKDYGNNDRCIISTKK
jgi:release factor glutamine methyltransferase